MKYKEEKMINDNLNFLIDIAKQEYDNFFKRSQTLDAKIGVIITIIGTITAYSMDINYLENLFENMNKFHFLEGLLYVALLSIFIIIVIMATIVIMAKKTRFLPLTLLDDELLQKNSIELKRIVLFNSYKETLEKNDIVLRRKNNKFNIICILSLIEIFVVIVLQLIKIVV